MAKAKTKVPNLANATPEFLADEIGKLAEARKENEKMEKLYKEALKARCKNLGIDFVQGEEFEVSITKSDRTALDTTAVKAEMGDDWWAERCKISEVTTVRSGRLGTLANAADTYSE